MHVHAQTDPLIERVSQKLAQVNDYVAEGIMKTNVSFIKASLGKVKVYFKNNDIIAHIRLTKYNLSTEFAKHKWPFNIDTIKHKYNENKWNYKQSMFNPLYHSNPS